MKPILIGDPVAAPPGALVAGVVVAPGAVVPDGAEVVGELLGDFELEQPAPRRATTPITARAGAQRLRLVVEGRLLVIFSCHPSGEEWIDLSR
jgi:hypothetical protein